MNPTQLIEWLKNPAQLDKSSLLSLKSLVDDYPCFTTARMLYLKNLAVMQDVRFSNELVRTAISSPDRRRLFQFMEDRTDDSLTATEPAATSGSTDFSLIDRFLHHSGAVADEQPDLKGDAPDRVDAPVGVDTSVGIDASKDIDVPDGMVESTATTPQGGVQPGLEGFTLDYLSFQRFHTTPSELENAEETPLHGHTLIDAFLEKGASTLKQERLAALVADDESGQPVSTGSDNSFDNETQTDDERVEALVDALPEDSFSEALAKIYLKQKRYDRALEIIKSLRLKYPEKNSYFADQIRFLEKLIIHTKH